MINKKIIFLILFLILILILIIIAQSVLTKPKKDKETLPAPTPLEEPKPLDTKTSIQDFAVIEVSPDTSTAISDRFQPIEITFNKPVNETTINLSLVPNNNVNIKLSRTKLGYSFLEIIPISPWADNQSYQLILSKDIQATDGTKLRGDYLVNFRIEAYLGL